MNFTRAHLDEPKSSKARRPGTNISPMNGAKKAEMDGDRRHRNPALELTARRELERLSTIVLDRRRF